GWRPRPGGRGRRAGGRRNREEARWGRRRRGATRRDPRALELAGQLVAPGKPAAARREGAPEIQDLGGGAAASAGGGEQQAAARSQERAHVGEQRPASIDGKVVDVVVEGGEAEGAAGQSLQDVPLLDPDAIRQPPGPDVLAGQRHDVRREVDAERRELGVARRGRPYVDRAAAAYLKETD